MDVIEPTAPPLYPKVDEELNAENFRLNKTNLILSYLDGEAKHYENVRKRYARARSVLHKIAVTTGALSVVLTGSGVATSLTGPGIIVGIPLAGIGGACGLISAVCTTMMKKLSTKISKHDKNIMLAKSKSNTINDLTSKALRDRKIDDVEFSIILAEADKYEKMKSEIRDKKIIVKDLTEEERKKNIPSSQRRATKKTRSINIYFQKNENGFSLHIEKHKTF